jgi:alkylation response protein AidB-like acyl-CoA dehydrogenase
MGGIYVKDDMGGSNLGRLDAAVIFEGLASGCPSFSAYISIHNMVAWMIDRFGNEKQRSTWLPKLCSMEWLASYCLTEPGSGSDAAALKTRAELKGDHYLVNGTKQFISGAGSNDVYLTMVRTSDDGAGGISCLMIPKDLKGVSFGANERKMGWKNQPTAQVIFDNVEVPVENLVGAEGKGFNIAMAGLDGGRLNISACSLGGAQSAFEIANQYMNERMAFGKKLHDFQALQFRVADMSSELEAARLMLYSAASKYDQEHPKTTLYSAMAKRYVTDAGFKVANDALQMLGGYGYLADYGIEKLVRDLRVHQILEGTNEIMRVIIARELARSN